MLVTGRIKILSKDGMDWKIVHQLLIDACTDDGVLDEDQLAEWSAVLRKNRIKTAKVWIDAKRSVLPETLIKLFGVALVGCLDRLAGMPSAAGWCLSICARGATCLFSEYFLAGVVVCSVVISILACAASLCFCCYLWLAAPASAGRLLSFSKFGCGELSALERLRKTFPGLSATGWCSAVICYFCCCCGFVAAC